MPDCIGMGSNALKRLRLARGLSQNQLARLSGVPQPMLSRFENAKAQPKGLASVLAVAEALGVRVEDLWAAPKKSPKGQPTGSAD